MDLFLEALIRPFAASAILIPAFALAALLFRVMPDSRLKRFLFRRLPGHRQKPGLSPHRTKRR